MLSATSLLAGNVDALLLGLCTHLGDVAFEAGETSSVRRHRAMSGALDVVWACGLLAARAVATRALPGTIRLAPVFAGRAGPTYRSVIIAHASGPSSLEDAGGSVLAINERESWSGHHALRERLAALGSQPHFAGMVVTGSHAASLEAVRQGTADIAAIDDTVWAWMMDRGRTEGLHVVDRTRQWPAPPLVFTDRLALEPAEQLEARLLELQPGQVPGLDGFRRARASDYAAMVEIAASGDPRPAS